MGSGIIVSLLAYWTALAFVEQPVNPLSSAPLPGQAEPIIIKQTATPDPSQPTPPVVLVEETAFPTLDPQEQIQVQQTRDSIRGTVEASGRITVLVMGIDRRPGEEFRSLTDTMMVVSVNPLDNTASIMNVPRDFYAQIPGVGRYRINTAFNWGYGTGGPAGGAQLAMRTVEQNLAIKIDHYVLLDFTAFIRSIDAIGGVDIDVPTNIYDATYPTMNYGYELFAVSAGPNHFDGENTLKYARTRHNDDDFGRAERQQQVVMAVRDKVLTMGVDQLLLQLPILYNEVSDGVRTDLSVGDMYSLAVMARDMPRENIRTVVLDYRYFTPYNIGGQQVLVLQNATVGPVIAELFYD